MSIRVEQRLWTSRDGWTVLPGSADAADAQLLLVFGGRVALEDDAARAAIRSAFPSANVVGCSTAGEICGTDVSDDCVVATALHFEHTGVRVAVEPLPSAIESEAVGERIARALLGDGLTHVLVLSEGVHVNGSELLAGLRRALPPSVVVTGGLAGDGAQFERTYVWHDDALLERHVIAVGLYGDRLHVGYGSMGGWDPFGPERVITRSEGNVLYELDGGSALALYKSYLGAYAGDLPSSGLLFPLSLRGDGTGPGVVRTILGIDEDAGSLTFAGDIPQGGVAQLMKANVDRLIDGSQGAATAAHSVMGQHTPDVALLISCVGRKLVLKQRVEEEVESVREVLGVNVPLCGFYSYGEIAPFTGSVRCELHNQTMTITTLDER